MPLPHFIEHLYAKRFGRERPEIVRSIEEREGFEQEKAVAASSVRTPHRLQDPYTGHDPNTGCHLRLSRFLTHRKYANAGRHARC
jgi:hypothetical protein